MKKINLKVILIYFSLTIFNISFFTVAIYENQIDLITESSKFQAKELASEIYFSLNNAIDEINRSNETNEQILEKLKVSLNQRLKDYLIYQDNGTVLYQSSQRIVMNDDLRGYVVKALANRDILGKNFQLKVDEKKFELTFIMPLSILKLDSPVLIFQYSIREISNRLSNLYRLILIVVILLILFHIVFSVILHRIVIVPIHVLHKKSIEISQGDLTARVPVKTRDEIGELSQSFNDMADKLAEKIRQLQNKNEVMESELKVASEVQSVIYPHFKEIKAFDVAAYHKPFGVVSGDYHDCFEIDDNRYGFLIADVCGHGVPAALITMLAKEMFKRLVTKYDDPKEIFQLINNEVYDLLNEYSAFFTAFYFIIDKQGNLIYSNAGHCPAYVLTKDGKLFELDTEGFVVGIFGSIQDAYFTNRSAVSSGDKIILYTDGIVEARNTSNVVFGQERFKKVLAKSYSSSSDKMLEMIMNEFNQFIGKAPVQDDTTVYIIGIK